MERASRVILTVHLSCHPCLPGPENPIARAPDSYFCFFRFADGICNLRRRSSSIKAVGEANQPSAVAVSCRSTSAHVSISSLASPRSFQVGKTLRKPMPTSMLRIARYACVETLALDIVVAALSREISLFRLAARSSLYCLMISSLNRVLLDRLKR